MYRNNDLTAAFGRAQLKKLDWYLEVQKRNANVLTNILKDVEGLILPYVPENCEHNWYNYTIRLDMDYFGIKKDIRRFRDYVLKAIQAEGVKCGIWQSFILPAMTVFQAKNAYGKGCPWSCKYYDKKIDYNPEEYPIAQKHCDTHFGMTEPLRAPNDEKVAELVGIAIKKVIEKVKEIGPQRFIEKIEEILK